MLRIRLSTALVVLGLILVGGGWPSTAGAAGFLFEIKNDCVNAARVALRYKDAASGSWRTKGWFLIEPGRAITPTSGGKKLRTDNSVFYFYGATEDRETVWAGDAEDKADRTYTVDGRKLRFREKRDARGLRNLRLTCEHRYPSVPSPPVLPCIPGLDPCCVDFRPEWKWRGHGPFDACNLPPA